MLDVIKAPVLYDMMNEDYTNDIAMYESFLKKYKNILECGIGTGRLAIRLAQKGYKIAGVDNSLDMLDYLKNKIEHNNLAFNNIELFYQDLCDLRIPDRLFDFIYFPFCTFNYLLTQDEQYRTLKAVLKHLSHDGVILFDLLTEKTFPMTIFDQKDFFFKETTFDNQTIRIFLQNHFDPYTQMFTQIRTYKMYNEDAFVGEKIVRMCNRFFLLGELKLLFDKCGIIIENVYGDYLKSEYSRNSHELIVVASAKKI